MGPPGLKAEVCGVAGAALHTTVPAVLTRLEAWLEESALPWTALPPADSDELTEILRELGFSALDRVKAREALRAQAGTFFFMITS